MDGEGETVAVGSGVWGIGLVGVAAGEILQAVSNKKTSQNVNFAGGASRKIRI